MADIPYKPILGKGNEVELAVSMHGETVGFSPEFVFSDGILRDKHREEHGDDDIYHGYDYDADPRRFRSVRIFKIAHGQEITLHEGEYWRGRVDDWMISNRKSKDGRTIIYVIVCDLQPVYSREEERMGDRLVVSLKCGSRVLRQQIVPLQERLYRFREKGDPTSITEMRGLGTQQRPFARTELFPRRTTLQKLVEAELSIFSGKHLQSPALRNLAVQNISQTILVVSPEEMRKYCALPFVGRNASLNGVLGRR